MTDQADLLARIEALESEMARERDIREIHDVLARYSRALDWLDDEMIETVFYDDAEIDYGFFKGSGKDFKPVLMELEHSMPRRWHYTSQISVELDGDRAEVESYNLSLALATQAPSETDAFSIFFGFYKDRFLKRGGKWGIIGRKHLAVSGSQLMEGAPEGDMGDLNQIGKTGTGHPDYRRLAAATPLDNP